MHWEIQRSPHLRRQVRGKVSGTLAVPAHQGSSITLTTGTKEEMIGQIIGTICPKWRL
jgi:hypothetical protein